MFSHFENDLFAQEVILRLYTKYPDMPGTLGDEIKTKANSVQLSWSWD